MGMVNGMYPNTLAGGLSNGALLGSTLPLMRRRLALGSNGTEAELATQDYNDTAEAARSSSSSASRDALTTAAPPPVRSDSGETVEAARKAHESYRKLRQYLTKHYTLGASAVGGRLVEDEGEEQSPPAA